MIPTWKKKEYSVHARPDHAHRRLRPAGRRHFVFEDRTTVLLGKQRDCHIRFPKDYGTVSRHHCLIDLNPPDARIRDLGSRNGTFINHRLIGMRPKGQPLPEGVPLAFEEVELADGDVIKIGDAKIRVAVHTPCLCTTCSAEVPPEQQEQSREPTGEYVCITCRTMLPPGGPAIRPGNTRICVKCGRDVSQEAGGRSSGDYTCLACREAPDQVVGKLLLDANTGANELLALRDHHIEKELGRGGMGAVYLARHVPSGRQVALKVMLPLVAATARSRDLFLREIATTRLLDHRHVVRLFDTGAYLGTFFFTLEYCAGGSMHDLLKKHGKPVSPENALRFICQVLAGLEYAHNLPLPSVQLLHGASSARGLVHRDIKPQNLFLAKAGEKYTVKVGDYGLAKAFDLAGLSGLTATGTKAGTPIFMPRQQLIDYKYAKPEVDVWAVAASLYYMLTLRPPRRFGGGRDPWQVVLNSDAVPIRERNPDIPARLAAVIDEALIDNPEIRFKSASELREALDEAM